MFIAPFSQVRYERSEQDRNFRIAIGTAHRFGPCDRAEILPLQISCSPLFIEFCCRLSEKATPLACFRMCENSRYF